MNRVAVVDQVDQVKQVVVDQGKKRLRALTEDIGTVHKKGEGKV